MEGPLTSHGGGPLSLKVHNFPWRAHYPGREPTQNLGADKFSMDSPLTSQGGGPLRAPKYTIFHEGPTTQGRADSELQSRQIFHRGPTNQAGPTKNFRVDRFAVEGLHTLRGGGPLRNLMYTNLQWRALHRVGAHCIELHSIHIFHGGPAIWAGAYSDKFLWRAQ